MVICEDCEECEDLNPNLYKIEKGPIRIRWIQSKDKQY